MATIYLRLPHYIASFLRNLDAEHPVPVGQPFTIERSDPLFPDVCFRAEPNMRGAVNIDCFSQKQWEAMQKGKHLAMPSDGSFLMDMQRNYREPLTISEVFILSGHEERVKRDNETMELAPDSEYIDEYVPFLLPSVIVRDGREQKVYSDWYVPNTSSIRNELLERYKMGLARFIALDRERANTLKIQRSKMEAIDRFMLRYDIRPGEREREQIKKMMQRSEMSLKLSFDSDIDHGRWSDELHIEKKLHRNSPKPILCRDTGEVFPSIAAFAKHIGVSDAIARNALKRGYRCNGLNIEYLND